MGNIQKIILLVTILSFHRIGTTYGCHKEELNALLQLKSAINYPNGNSLPTWKEKGLSNCCNWERVYCGKSRQVVSLDLEYKRDPEVQGDWFLNASLFLPFQHLQELYLDGNSITGWTKHLRQLSSLKVLHLSSNKLKGVIDLHDVEALQNLNTLDLSGNSIDGFKRSHGATSSKLEKLSMDDITFHDANTLLDSLFSFPSLKFLSLMGNDFKGVIKTTTVFQNLQQLETLTLYGSPLSQTFLQSFGRMESLEILIMHNTMLEGDISTHGWLCQLKKLQMLDLSQNDLYGQLPSCLGNLTSIFLLDLSFNQLTGNVANSPLTQLTSLKFLSLSHNKFQIPHTFRSFANHSSLELLSLNGNSLVPDHATSQSFTPKLQLSFLSLSNCDTGPALPNFLLTQYNLTFLDLSHNKIGGNLPSWIVENNTYLNKLILADNSFIGSLHLPRHPHSHIEVLDVSNNNISNVWANLSRSLPHLTFLNLSRNSIKEITPFYFGGMEGLIFLDLSYNHLTGEIPNFFIKGCYSLKILLMNDNNFSRVNPSTLFPASLVSLDMSNNHLEGQIPGSMCTFINLIILNLSNNSLSGFLPSCFHAPFLTYLYLNKNKLNVPLLRVLKNSTSLVTLDLGDNQLSGAIPEWIGDLENLSILSLHNNHFVGQIPAQYCSLDQLTILDLSVNNISGQIPSCLGKMTFQPHEPKSSFDAMTTFGEYPLFDAMEVEFFFFDTKEYAFELAPQSYTIQNGMEVTTKSHTYNYVGIDLDDMSGIDLSCNKLTGDIPLEIGSITGVRALNLSYNEITGSIPSTLSKLSQIESLDLSYNNLNGSIPSELIQLNALAIFSVAHNNLSGRIPEPKSQFGTFGESNYEGNPFLCGTPLLNDCSTSSPYLSNDLDVDDDDGSMDMDIFRICFLVSSVIMFFGTLIVLYVNPHWRGVWFYYGDMWTTSTYYFIVDCLRFIHCWPFAY